MSVNPLQISFSKMQGIGNDFVVIDARILPQIDWTSLAIKLCDRKFGIGADGLLVLEESQTSDAFMRMYNPDGTPDVCGNGLRCVARYIAQRWGVYSDLSDVELSIDTFGGNYHASVKDVASDSPVILVTMSYPKFGACDIPFAADLDCVKDYKLSVLDREFAITALSTGSTHTIIFCDDLPEDADFFRYSPAIESHILFPERTSIMWTKVVETGRLKIRIWERGAGETWGCGTGACAVGVAAMTHGFAHTEAIVESRGGALTIRWQSGGEVSMIGPAEFVFEGSLVLA